MFRSCKYLVPAVFVIAALMLFGCIGGGNVSLSNLTQFGPCVSGQVTYCKAPGATPCACTTDWAPVCGTDGRTYSNACVARCAGVQFTDGACGGACAKFGETCGVVATTGAAQLERKCCDGVCANGLCQKPDMYTCPDGTVVTSQDQCPQPAIGTQPTPCLCMANWDPVCGVDGKTYENKCVATCKNVGVAHEGACENLCVKEGLPCATVASLGVGGGYSPVTTGVGGGYSPVTTYLSNQTCCEGRMCINGICQKPHEYTCADGSVVESPNDCPVIDCGCPTDWDPVCLTGENKTYPNMCIARCGGISPNLLTPGECGDTPACNQEGEKCYRQVERCEIDSTTGEKYCKNVTESNCCDNLVCSDGYCKRPINECALVGEGCDNKACCEGYECVSSYASTVAANIPQKVCIKPQCRRDADSCQSATECCSGICTNGQCGSQGGCLDTGKTCEKGAQCCSQWCNNGVCSKREHECVNSGESCKRNEECCSGICDPERYVCIDQCAKVDEACSDAKPCCPNSGAYCKDGVCRKPDNACNAEGARCGSPPQTFLAALIPSYGDCCQGLACINYNCRQPPACDCPQVYDPVCGADGKTYGNACRARCANTYATYAGPCRDETLCSKAFERCGRVYDQEKNKVYDYGTCCEGATCQNNVCVPPSDECPNQCRQYGERCGVVQLQSGLRMSFGDCCNGMGCANNRCRGPNQCVQPGASCYMPPATLITNLPQNYQGNCCDGSRCVQGTCREIPQGCNETGKRCVNDNNCCQGRCLNGICSPEQPSCRKTGEACTQNDRCCETTDACRPSSQTAAAVIYICQPSVTPTPTPTPACVQRGAICTPGASRCCDAGLACVQNPNVVVALTYWCAQQPTPTPTPSCKQRGATCNPDTDTCCDSYLSCVPNPNVVVALVYWCGVKPTPTPTPTPTPACVERGATCDPQTDTCCNQLKCVQNPNVYTHVAYWCSVPATPTPTPTPTPQMCSDTDGDNSQSPDIYTKGTATGTLVTGGSGSFTDYCLSQSKLYEYDCASPGQTSTVTAQTITCPRGTECRDGACVQVPG